MWKTLQPWTRLRPLWCSGRPFTEGAAPVAWSGVAAGSHLPAAGGRGGLRARPGPSAEATTPAADATTARPGPTTAPAGGATTATLPAGYLADAIELIGRNAYYADRVDWPAARAEAHRRAGASREGAYEAIRWVLSELGDGHSLLLTPEELRAAETGGEPSFGLTALFPERVVVDVEPGGGAERAGVRVGDVVQSVDGRPAQGDRTVSLPSPTDGGRPARTVLALRRGRGDRARQLQVTVEPAGVSEVRPPTVRRLSAGVGALELFGVASAEGREGLRYIEAAHDGIRRIAGRRTCGWVVDLRRDPGGSAPPMLLAAGPVLGDGKAVGYRDRSGVTLWYSYRDGALILAVSGQPPWSLAAPRPARLARPSPPVAVLTSRLTASAGEAVVMAFRGRPRRPYLRVPYPTRPAGRDRLDPLRHCGRPGGPGGHRLAPRPLRPRVTAGGRGRAGTLNLDPGAATLGRWRTRVRCRPAGTCFSTSAGLDSGSPGIRSGTWWC
jgi:carboxyl-terminal processing protease